MSITAQELAVLIQGTVEGDLHKSVSAPAKIEEATTDQITFLGNLKYESYLYDNQPGIVIVPKEYELKSTIKSTLIRVTDVYGAVQKLLTAFNQQTDNEVGIHDSAQIGRNLKLGENVSIGALVYVGSDVQIGNGTNIRPQVYIGDRVFLGRNVELYPGVRIYDDTVIGNNCTIHANSVIGSDGFGYAKSGEGIFEKIQHIGNVVIEDDVEIGANTCVDRAVMGSTIIKNGVKLDNLIQVAHNVVIGERTGIAALTGIAGSAKIGSDCFIGGQVGIMGHISIADGTMIQAQSGIMSSIKEKGGKVAGSPSMDYLNFLKSSAVFKNLPQLKKDVDQLMKNS